MDVDEKLIEHVATLARLKLNKEEIKEFTPQLKEVLDSFSKLDEVKTDGVDISPQPVEIRNVLREDKVEASLAQEDALANSEHKKDGYFKGPRAV
jgi:aspartyl-tRNA(Asn)/glutamyl-tRNA(Gln) amidotransferase subunit C